MKPTQNFDVSPRLTDRRGAALYLAVCARTVRNLVRRGELAEVRIGGRCLYDLADLDALIEAHKQLHLKGQPCGEHLR